MLETSRHEGLPPDLEELAADSNRRPAAELAALLRQHQQRRWATGRAVPAEDYLRWFPHLSDRGDDALSLINAEVALRRGRGERPSLEEYLARFPRFEEPLRREFEAPPPASAPTPPPTEEAHQTPRDAGPVAPAPTPEVPGYEILEELGRGGMGVVYKARHLALRRTVALKVVRGGPSGGEEVARFRTEAEAAARLTHPNIVSIYEIGEHAGLPYFSLEFCPGGSLEKRLKDNPLPAREAAALVERLAAAMQTAHEAQVIHRDLKPANVLLTRGGGGSPPAPRPDGRPANPSDEWVPKVSDFGLAKKLDDVGLTQSGAILGTPSYMAPEQAKGHGKDVGPQADVYALGAILYECLTGRPPFKAATTLETLLQVQTDDPVAPRALQPGVPRDLETVTLKCLQKQPVKRYASAGDLAADLGRFLAGEPITARPVGAFGRAVRWVKRRPAAAIAIAVSSLALVTLTAGLAIALVVVRGERDIARSQREKAVQANARARAALNQVSSQAIETFLQQQPRLTDQHKGFLRRALELYGELAEDADASPETRAAVARAHMQMGLIRTKLGELTEAKVAYERAVEMLTELTASDPPLRNDLAKTFDDLGLLQYRMGNREEAENRFRQATEQFVILCREQPDNVKYLMNQANGRINWANVLADRNDRGAAERHYREAIALMEALPPKDANSPDTRDRIAMAYYNLAYLFDEMGKKKESEQVYGKAVAILEPLAKADPKSANLARKLSNCLINLADLAAERDAPEEAEKLFRRGLAIQEGLTRDYPSVPEYGKFLGRTLRNLGKLLRQRGQFPEAESTFRRALEVQRRLVKQYPKFPDYRRDLGSTYHDLGVLKGATGNHADAEANFRTSLEVLEPLVRGHPTIPEFRQAMGDTCVDLGDLLRKRRRFEEADQLCRQGLKHRVTLQTQFPQDPEYLLRLGAARGVVATVLAERGRPKESLPEFAAAIADLRGARGKMQHPPVGRQRDWLANAYAGRAGALAQLGRFPDALADWDEAVKAAPESGRGIVALRRALCLAQAGQVERAVAEVGRLEGEKPTAATSLWAARVYARAAGGDAARKEEFAARAVDLLRQAGKGGLAAEEVALLKDDPHLESLRSRRDFQGWLAGLGPAKK